MQITASAISVNVADVQASSEWARKYLGFDAAMSATASVRSPHPDAGFNLIYLRTGHRRSNQPPRRHRHRAPRGVHRRGHRR